VYFTLFQVQGVQVGWSIARTQISQNYNTVYIRG
jgi:hypothetical protein